MSRRKKQSRATTLDLFGSRFAAVDRELKRQRRRQP